jgi:Large extracellular alpha-helical protein
VTNYAGHFLVEAEKCGYLVPQEMIVNWKKFQTNKSHSWLTGSEKSALIQAYRLYTLALYKYAPAKLMKTLLFREA